MQQKKWILGNWKMNGRLAQNADVLSGLLKQPIASENVFVGIAVPSVYIGAAAAQVSGSRCVIGAQDVSRFAADGAYTGEINAAMLQDAGVQFVLIGHSERRQYFGENNAILTEKWQNSLNADLVPVLCVGETLVEREAGLAESVVAEQLSILDGRELSHVVAAYEPVWAIGTGKVANHEQIGAMHAFIHERILSLCGNNVKIRTLYGGSVNESNAADILTVPHVDGALVGGASLKADSFAAIIQAAAKIEAQN
ncbi:triose-phosphate isomerase [Stenoxybacter acetivorans]|uniref:triose-phosphate isomerase n=1 Tax=Stenoxybacter acetivorans TaxID=422441 RepID=UPI000A9EA8EB|nr:triose-phosphate isomerase [Stenoxybacter acetivorans]